MSWEEKRVWYPTAQRTEGCRGVRLAQSVKQATLDLGAVGSGPTLRVELTLKKEREQKVAKMRAVKRLSKVRTEKSIRCDPSESSCRGLVGLKSRIGLTLRKRLNKAFGNFCCEGKQGNGVAAGRVHGIFKTGNKVWCQKKK